MSDWDDTAAAVRDREDDGLVGWAFGWGLGLGLLLGVVAGVLVGVGR